MIGANVGLWLLYVHFSKACLTGSLTSCRSFVWIFGATIFLFSILACFTGYILVFSQMSYWALIVILNLLTVLPIVDVLVISSILAGEYVSVWSVSRLINIHWLIVLITLVAVGVHFVFVHRLRPGMYLLALDGVVNIADIVILKTA